MVYINKLIANFVGYTNKLVANTALKTPRLSRRNFVGYINKFADITASGRARSPPRSLRQP